MKETVMPLHGLNQKLKRLKQGVTIYKVYAFPDRIDYATSLNTLGWIVKLVVNKRPQVNVSKSLGGYEYKFVECTERLEGKAYITMPSLYDMGLLSQTYNNHRTFFSERKAKAYLKLVQSGCNVNRKVIF